MKTHLSAVILLAGSVAMPVFANGEIVNPSFEYGWSGWVDVDPDKNATSISGHFHTGEKSAKITRETGRFEQAVTLLPDSEYILKAVVKGPGAVGLTLAGETLSATSEGEGETWLPLEIPFATTSDVDATLFGAPHGGEGRFDDFELVALSGPALSAAEELSLIHI